MIKSHHSLALTKATVTQWLFEEVVKETLGVSFF